MATLSVPLTSKLENIVNNLVRDGFASNKAEVMRKALLRTAEEEAIKVVLEAQRDPVILRGDLREILKNLPD